MGTKIKFYMDEHVSRAVVRGLRQRGLDVLTVMEADMRSASDKSHMERAYVEHRIIFTQDDDFLRMHAMGIKHAGIVYASQQISTGEIIRGLMVIHQILDAEDMEEQVEYL